MNLIDDTGIGRLIGKIKRALDTKVDKVSGKGLSTNDYTTTEKTKLSGIAEGAEANVQADWNATDTTSDAYIKNKPAIPTVGNGTITIKQAGTPKGTFTMNQSGNTTIELTDSDTNTWRGIQNNLTSDSTTDSLAAKQGKILKAEIDDLKNSVSDGKTLVANAITGKGVTTATDAAFQTIANNIGKIVTLTAGTADATASAGNILSGKTAYVNGTKVSGTMPNQGAKTAALNCGGEYTIPAGYHNGSGKVTANSLASQITPTAVYNKYKLAIRTLAELPLDVTSANCIVDGHDNIYLIGGNNGKVAIRYNIFSNAYTTLSQAPENIAYNSAVKLGSYIICIGENHMLFYDMVTNVWYTSTTLPSGVKGGSIILDNQIFIFNNSYVFEYSVNLTTSIPGGTFSTSPLALSQTACSSKNTAIHKVALHHQYFTTFGEENTIRTISESSLAGSTQKCTLPGHIFGGVTIIPNEKAVMTCVQYLGRHYICNLFNNYTLTSFAGITHDFFTAAVCSVGDDVYIFGSGSSSVKYMASIIHTEEFLCRHY